MHLKGIDSMNEADEGKWGISAERLRNFRMMPAHADGLTAGNRWRQSATEQHLANLKSLVVAGNYGFEQGVDYSALVSERLIFDATSALPPADLWNDLNALESYDKPGFGLGFAEGAIPSA